MMCGNTGQLGQIAAAPHEMYHPLMIFNGESGQLISALLTPGDLHASRGAAVLSSIWKFDLDPAQARIAGRGGHRP